MNATKPDAVTAALKALNPVMQSISQHLTIDLVDVANTNINIDLSICVTGLPALTDQPLNAIVRC